jgi:FAD/FMN-containing dehydrogenase
MGRIEILRSDDPGYDDARHVWNAMIDRRPALIARCHETADVVTAIALARRDRLEIGVRCGGHSVAGHAVPEGGLMIDLTPMDGVRVDPDRRRAWVQGGALLGAMDAASQQYGLATTAGNVSHTGVGGLTLGGGMGWLAREYGLACDNVLSFEVVTAAGEVVRASAAENTELFWGLRGGGGNFGVVTEFEFQLHVTGTETLTVELDFPKAEAAPALASWRDLALAGPRRATYTALISGGTAALGFVWVGDPDAGRELARSLEVLGAPVARRVIELTYVDLQRCADTPQGHALRRYWKGHYLPELPDSAIGALLAHDPSMGASLQTYGGAIADVPADATAFGHRGTAFEYIGAARWTDAAEDASRMATVRECAGRIEPFARGAYVNALSDDGQSGVSRAYPAAVLARLAALKDAVDPENVFHLNHNIRPSRKVPPAGVPPDL